MNSEKSSAELKICECPVAGFCHRYQRQMGPRPHAICTGAALSPDQQVAYRANWAAMSQPKPAGGMKVVRDGKPAPPASAAPSPTPGPCIHLGAHLRDEICQFCKRRRKLTAVHQCAIWGECSIRPYRAGQPEQSCRGCEQFTPSKPPIPQAVAISAVSPTPASPAAPAGPPFGIPIPRDLTPLPAGRDTFNGGEWRQLPREHQDYYRALRRAREAAQAPAAPRASASATSTHTPQAMPRDRSPFSSPDGRPIFLDQYGQGASCFIVLSGPSLLTNDLSELSRRGIFTIGVNNSPSLVRCNGWVFVDTPAKFHDGIWRDPGCMKFVHRRFLQRSVRTRKPDGTFETMNGSDGKPLLINELPGVIGIERNADFNPSRWLAEPSMNWGQSKKSATRARGKYPQVLNVMFCVLKLAYALGFRVVYLVGCDFQMSAERPYAFPQAKSPGAASSNNGSYEKLNKMLGELQPHFLAANYHVFNCNRDSGLTVFPFVTYKQAIATATQQTPQGTLDASGWYDAFGGN